MKKIFITVPSVILATPLVAFATDTNAFDILATVAQFLGYITPVLVTVAVVYFIWVVIQYTISGDENKKKEAKAAIPKALIGLFIIVAFWGILSVVRNTFGIGPEQLHPGDIPCIPNPALGVECYR